MTIKEAVMGLALRTSTPVSFYYNMDDLEFEAWREAFEKEAARNADE